MKSCSKCGSEPRMVHSYDADGCYWSHMECTSCDNRTLGSWVSHRSDACPIFYQEVRNEWDEENT